MADDPRTRDETASPFWLLLAVFAVSGALGFVVLPRVFAARSPLVGKPAPDFSLAVVHGGDEGARVHLAALQGHPVLLDFWATWCGPCQLEAPILERAYARRKRDGLVVVGVDTGDKAGAARRFAEQRGLTYPIAYDEGDTVQALYDVTSLPTLVLVASDGTVLDVESGLVSEKALDAMLDQAR